MTGIVLTKYSGFILGPIARVLGVLMEGIFNILNIIGIPNIGLSIIIFTIVIYLLMMPLTIKQQKFSKLSAKMNPELQAIQAKYKNKKDNDSMMAMNEETRAVYAKYGVSPRKLYSADYSNAYFICFVSCNLCNACLCK